MLETYYRYLGVAYYGRLSKTTVSKGGHDERTPVRLAGMRKEYWFPLLTSIVSHYCEVTAYLLKARNVA